MSFFFCVGPDQDTKMSFFFLHYGTQLSDWGLDQGGAACSNSRPPPPVPSRPPKVVEPVFLQCLVSSADEGRGLPGCGGGSVGWPRLSRRGGMAWMGVCRAVRGAHPAPGLALRLGGLPQGPGPPVVRACTGAEMGCGGM